MIAAGGPLTIDTNIAIYALSTEAKADRAGELLRTCAFLSVQVLNEYANVGLRKRRDSYKVVEADLADLRNAVPLIVPIRNQANCNALKLAERYQLSFYDALMLAVAAEGGARTIYSEDMQHGLLVEGSLRVLDPFRE